MKNLVAILWMAAFSTHAQLYKDVEFKSMENFSLDKKDGQLVVGFNYVIYNPNWYNIIIKPSGLNLTIAGQDCGIVQVQEKVKLHKKKEQSYHFQLVGDPNKLVKSAFVSVWSILMGKGVDINIRGPLKAGALILRKTWPIDYTYSMNFETFLSAF